MQLRFAAGAARSCAILFVVLLPLLLGSSRASARATDAEVKTWVHACLDALRSDDPAVRSGAEAALSTLGPQDMRIMLAGAERLSSDRDFTSLHRALIGMGAKAAIHELERTAEAFPRSRRKRFYPLHGALMKPRSVPAPEWAPGTPPGCRAFEDVIRLHTRGRGSKGTRDDATQVLQQAGDAAAPLCMTGLARGAPGSRIAARVLDEVTSDRVRLHVADYLDAGNPKAAHLVATARSLRTDDLLIRAIKAGGVDWQFFQILPVAAGDTPLSRSVLEFVTKERYRDGYDAAEAAAWLVRSRAHGFRESLFKSGAKAPRDRLPILEAASRLGSAEALSSVIALLDPAAPNRAAPHAVDRILDLVGTVAWRRFRSGDPNDRDAAAQRAQAWWKDARPHLAFDPARGLWIDKRETK